MYGLFFVGDNRELERGLTKPASVGQYLRLTSLLTRDKKTWPLAIGDIFFIRIQSLRVIVLRSRRNQHVQDSYKSNMGTILAPLWGNHRQDSTLI
jgi:hypothetical protein